MAKKVNWGKRHEVAFREATKNIENLICERFWDSMGGRMHLKSPSDFIAYKSPNLYYIECKSTDGDTLPLANISNHQWGTLTERSKIKGCTSGVLIEYRHNPTHSVVVFVNITYLNQIKNRQGKKYITSEEAILNGILIETQLKRTNFKYNLQNLFI